MKKVYFAAEESVYIMKKQLKHDIDFEQDEVQKSGEGRMGDLLLWRNS